MSKNWLEQLDEFPLPINKLPYKGRVTNNGYGRSPRNTNQVHLRDRDWYAIGHDSKPREVPKETVSRSCDFVLTTLDVAPF